MGTGGKAKIVFKNELGKEYLLKKAVFILDGKEMPWTMSINDIGGSDEGTILLEGPLALGSHRLQVALAFEGAGGLFDYVKSYRFNMRDELAFVSKGAQESNIVIAAYKRGDFTTSFEKRPHLKFDGDYSQGVALNISAQDLKELERLRKEREILENKLAMIDNMGTGIKRSKVETEKYIGSMDRLLHEVKIAVGDAKAQLRALDQLLTDSTFIRKRTKEDLVILRKRLASLKKSVRDYESMTLLYQDQLDEAREEMVLSSVGGASKELIEKAYEHAVAKETAMLSKIESAGSETSGYKVVRRLREQVRKLKKRNRKLQKRLSKAVTRQVKTMRAIVNKEKRKLAKYQKRVARMNDKASDTAQNAVQLALGQVISDFDNIIVRADIGLADTSFQKKQVHTREIGKLQQAKSEELSNLNQIYMDLQGDEVQ